MAGVRSEPGNCLTVCYSTNALSHSANTLSNTLFHADAPDIDNESQS